MSWNVDGLARVVDDLPALVDALGRPEILCLQEVRIRDDDAPAITRMRNALSGYDCHASLNRDRVNASFRGGRTYGVATYVARRCGRVVARTPEWDLEGRVVITELPARGIAVADVYGVNGTSKPYVREGLVVGDRHAWKRDVQRLLGEELAALQARGLAIIAIGDWNVSQARIDVTPRLRTEEPHATARRELHERFVDALGLVDVFRALHPDERAYTWRARGRLLDAARVDFALVSRELVPRVTAASILEDARGRSDHAPIVVTLRPPASARRGRGSASS